MRSCSHCIKMHLCKYYEKFNQDYMEAIKGRVLATGKVDTTTTPYAHLSFFGGIARSCMSFESMHEPLSEDEKQQLDIQAFKIKNNKEFLEEFWKAVSPEERIELISEYIEEYDLLSEDDDKSESIRAYILEKFGY